MLQKKKGASLVIVLIVLLVLSIFAISFIDVSSNEQKQVIREDKKTKAYYVARAGAEATAKYIIDNPKKAAALKTAGKSNPVNFGDGSFTVQIEEKADGSVSISSEGIVNNVKNKVVTNLNKVEATSLFKKSIATKGNLNVTGMKTVTGDLESTDGIVTAPYGYTYNTASNTNNKYPEPDLPTGLTLNGSINTKTGGPENIDSDGQYTSMTAWQKDITFVPNGNQLKIVVDDFTVKNANINIVTNGTTGGRVFLYVKHYADIQTPVVINGNASDLVIFLMNGATMDIQANASICGLIYGPNANVNLQSGNSSIYGSVIANSLGKNGPGTVSNGSVIYYSANDSVDIGPAVPMFEMGRWE